MDEKIKEMAKDMGIAFQLAGTTRFGAVAEILVEIGYRKESDTAREIFEWLEKHCFFNGFEIVETYFKEHYNLG